MVKKVRITSKQSKAANKRPTAKPIRAPEKNTPSKNADQCQAKRKTRRQRSRAFAYKNDKEVRPFEQNDEYDRESGTANHQSTLNSAKGDGRPRPGRPKGSKNMVTMVLRKLRASKSRVTIDGKKRKIS